MKLINNDVDGYRDAPPGLRIWCGGTVERSILSPRVRVRSYAHVEDSILLDGVEVGRHSHIRRAIVDKDVSIPPGTTIGLDPEKDARRFVLSPGGIVVIPKGADLSEA